MGQAIKKILSLNLLGQDEIQPAVPPGLTLSAPYSSRTIIRSSLITEELLRLPYFRLQNLCLQIVSARPQEPIPLYGAYRNPTACGSL